MKIENRARMEYSSSYTYILISFVDVLSKIYQNLINKIKHNEIPIFIDEEKIFSSLFEIICSIQFP